jgi:HPt (histidine-containing phosphotransfer) domain-containing protein
MESMQPPGDLERFRKTLQDLARDLGPDGLAEILASYLADSRRRVDSLRVLLDEDDLEGLGRCAHSLKGSSSIFGLIGLEEAALAVELASREPGDAGLGALIDRLRWCYAELEPMLREECAAPPGIPPRPGP